jgi:superfamily I DNA/RNA helicase
MELNVEQRAAVEATRNTVVTAGPGAGKTRVLIERFKRLMSEGIRPEDTLTMTFTESAAQEMADRAGTEAPVFRTFHSFCLDLIKKEREHLSFQLKPEVLPSGPDIFELIRDICQGLGGRVKYHKVQDYISGCKRRGVDPITALDVAIGEELFLATAYREYEAGCRRKGWLDFDSLLAEAVGLLENNPDIQARYKRKYVAADEFQDTDKTQFKLLRLIYDGNVFCVGDSNQNLFAWRSSVSDVDAQFLRTFPGAQRLFMGTNYRSTRSIVEFLKKIVPEDNGLASHIQAAPNAPEGQAPVFIQCNDAEDEVERVLGMIGDPEGTAIIARTNRQLWKFENACTRRNIPYKLLGKISFWDNNEIKDLMKIIKENRHDPRPPAQVIHHIMTVELLPRYIGAPRKFGTKDPLANLADAHILAERFKTVGEFIKHATKAQHASRKESGLSLCTVHAAKGREWRQVFVIGANQGILPHDKGDLAEERRIWFVAASRAIDYLVVSWYDKPSQFIVSFFNEEPQNVIYSWGGQSKLF